MILLLCALLFQEPQLERTSWFRFQPFDLGLPRSGQWRNGFAVGDLNDDGLPDLAFTSPRKQPGPPVIFLNLSRGQWSRWQEARFPSLPFDYGAVAVADFDGNGANDIAVASHLRGLAVVLGDGRGTFVPSQEGMTLRLPTSPEGSAPFSSRAVLAIDWNGDGRVDVAALSDGPRPGDRGVQLGVTVYENLGFVWKPTRASVRDVVFGDSIAAGDVDGDGLPDLVTASGNAADQRVLRLGSDGDLERRVMDTSLPASIVHAADLLDFDADGRDEIVIAYTSATEPRRAMLELVSFPSGSEPPLQLWSNEGNAKVAAVAAGDVNGDGSPDVVAAMEDGRLLTFRGNGRGFMTRDVDIEPPRWRSGCSAYAVRLADLDGDARDEIIASFAGEPSGCASGGGIEVWRAAPSNRRRSVRH